METTLNLTEIKTKTTTGVIFLSLRNFGLQAVSTIGFFLLTLLLGTGEVGLFAIVAESVSILGYFSDIGLASALIQKKEKITSKDLQTTFTVQQILVLIALTILSIVYSHISQTKGYGNKEFWITISLCFSFMAASLKTIPSVLLERNLNFKLLSTVDVVENIIFYTIAVTFAFFHFGAYSYAIAAFIRSLVGLILIYRFQPWSIGFAFDLTAAKKLFRFGIPFQLNSFIALAKDRLSSLLVAGIIGREGFGILSWAQKVTRLPLSFMDAIMKVTFPAFSRLQDHPDLLKKSIEKSCYFIALFVFPLLALISLLVPDLINLIPKYSKWTPAIIPVYFYAVAAAIAAITTPITNAFNATGKITLTTKLMIMWTVLTWILYPLLSQTHGYLGTSIAALLVGLSSFVVWGLCQKHFQVNLIKIIFKPLIFSLVSLVAGFFFSNFIIKFFLPIAIYCSLNWFFAKDQILWLIKELPWFKKSNI